LIGHLFENLFSQVASGNALVELYKLNDVPSCSLASRVSETATIAIKLLHCRKICSSNTNDDDGAWHLSQLTDQVNRLRHVMDDTIGEQKKDLVLVCAQLRLNIVLELRQERSEEGWTSEANLGECLPVCIDNSLDSKNIWVLWVAIHGKAVVNTIDAEMSRNTTESKDWEASIVVVWLNNSTDIEESSLVLVVSTHVMK